MILAGDIGGTKTNIGLFRSTGELIKQTTYRSDDHPGLLPIVQDFLGDNEVAAACFGIAGPVIDNQAETPNLAWHIDGDAVAHEARIPVLKLINDLEATAEGIPALAPDRIAVLNEGKAAHAGTVALIAAGTGLGMSLVTRPEGGWRPLPSEGGHQCFAPRNDEEIGLWKFLRARFGHVSAERVVSGPGIHHIYEFLLARGFAPETPEVAARLAQEDPAAVITEAALAAPAAGRVSCPLCARTLDMFLEAYGAAAGNLALVGLATGGVYVGGGIAPKLWPRIGEGTFMRGFLLESRMRSLLHSMPVWLIRDPLTALYGAARRAAQLAGVAA